MVFRRVLGTLLFLIHVGDLPKGLESYLNTFTDTVKIIRNEENSELLKPTKEAKAGSSTVRYLADEIQ